MLEPDLLVDAIQLVAPLAAFTKKLLVVGEPLGQELSRRPGVLIEIGQWKWPL